MFLILSRIFLHTCDSPTNLQELFNLCHASAHNIVERIFGILKNHFAILRSSPDLSMDAQARITPALAAIHNVIWKYDTGEIDRFIDDIDDSVEPGECTGDLAEGPARTAERRQADNRRDRIADSMWAQYQEVFQERGEA
jgi:DDE superfamily endonuclease